MVQYGSDQYVQQGVCGEIENEVAGIRVREKSIGPTGPTEMSEIEVGGEIFIW